MARSRLKMAHSRFRKRPGRGHKARKRPEEEIWPKPAPGQRGDPYPKTALED